jgi:hypothetical protein
MAEILRFDATRLVQEVVEDAVLVIDLGAGCCFALDGGAAVLWPSLIDGTTREGLLRAAEAAFDAPAHVVRPAVEAFLAELLAEGVVVQSTGMARAPALPSGKRPFDPPRVKRYDDLDELLQSGED